MAKFKVGDVVIMSRPKDISELPTWVPGLMDEFHEREVVVRRYSSAGYIQIEESGFFFNENWATLARDDLLSEDVGNVDFF